MSPPEKRLRAAGAMPTTVTGVLFSVMTRPTSDGSRPKRRVHRRSPIMATAAPGFSSASVNPRPATGAIPSTFSSAGLMRLPTNCSGSPAPLRLKLVNPIAASWSNARVSSRHDTKFSTDAPKFGRLSRSFFSATWTRRCESANGNGRSSTAFTTVNIAVFAAIASATVSMTAAENAGVRRIVRSAYRRSFISTCACSLGTVTMRSRATSSQTRSGGSCRARSRNICVISRPYSPRNSAGYSRSRARYRRSARSIISSAAIPPRGHGERASPDGRSLPSRFAARAA